jgi:hypothetical protein
MNIFNTLIVGDSAKWSDSAMALADGRIASSPDWVLTYWLRGPSKLDMPAIADGSGGWMSTLAANASAGLIAGLYAWSVTVASGAERFTVGFGQLTLQPDLAGKDEGHEARTPAQIALADCEAAMGTFNRTGGKVKRYDIAGRSMEFQSIGDLMQLHAFWKAKVEAEAATAGVAQGGVNPRNFYVRFVRPR